MARTERSAPFLLCIYSVNSNIYMVDYMSNGCFTDRSNQLRGETTVYRNSPIVLAILSMLSLHVACAEMFAITADYRGTVTGIPLVTAGEPRSFGAFEWRQGQMWGLAVRPGTAELYGCFTDGAVVMLDLSTHASRVVMEEPFQFTDGVSEISPDGAWLLIDGSLKERGKAGTFLVRASDWSIRHAFEKPGFYASAFSTDSRKLYYFDKGGVFELDLETDTPSLLCAVPDATIRFECQDMKCDANGPVLFCFDRFPRRPGKYNCCPYRIAGGKLEPIARLDGMEAEPCSGNTAGGPYWYYGSSGKPVFLQTGPNEWDKVSDLDTRDGVLYKVAPDCKQVTISRCNVDRIRADFPNDDLGEAQSNALSNVYVSPDGKWLVAERNRGYRYPVYIVVGDAGTVTWLRSYRIDGNGGCNVVFWDDGK
jgi:hypothetical protein